MPRRPRHAFGAAEPGPGAGGVRGGRGRGTTAPLRFPDPALRLTPRPSAGWRAAAVVVSQRSGRLRPVIDLPRTGISPVFAPVSESWSVIDAWLADHVPASLAELGLPATPEAVARTAVRLGLVLPADLRESLPCHDGDDSYLRILPCGPLYSNPSAPARRTCGARCRQPGRYGRRSRPRASPWWGHVRTRVASVAWVASVAGSTVGVRASSPGRFPAGEAATERLKRLKRPKVGDPGGARERAGGSSSVGDRSYRSDPSDRAGDLQPGPTPATRRGTGPARLSRFRSLGFSRWTKSQVRAHAPTPSATQATQGRVYEDIPVCVCAL
ncbi:hypothetical protein KAURM247S_05809 [Kitasatospora aureofaciens]